MKKRTGTGLFARTAALLLSGTLLLSGCAGSRFKPDKDLVGEGKLIESVEGLEKIDDKEIPAFLKAVNGKYPVESLKDGSGTFDIDMKGSATSKDLGGLAMELGLKLSFDGAFSRPDKISRAEGKMQLTLFGMQIPADLKFYAVEGEGDTVTYSQISAMGEEGNWEKETKKKEAAEEQRKELLQEGDVIALYQDKETKAYAALLNPDSETLKKGLEKGSEEGSLQEAAEKLDLKNKDLILTFDEGIGLIGFYTDLSGTIEDEFSADTFTIRAELKELNTGLEIKLPEEAEGAKEKTVNEDDPLDGLFDL